MSFVHYCCLERFQLKRESTLQPGTKSSSSLLCQLIACDRVRNVAGYLISRHHRACWSWERCEETASSLRSVSLATRLLLF